MIIGIHEPGRPAAALREALTQPGVRRMAGPESELHAVAGFAVLTRGPTARVALDAGHVCVVEGAFFAHAPDLLAWAEAGHPAGPLRRAVGRFSVVAFDRAARSCTLARDHLGVEPLFYHQRSGRLCFSSSLAALTALQDEHHLNPNALVQYLLYCYNPSDETLLQGIRKLPAGSILQHRGGRTSIEPFFSLDFSVRRPRRSEHAVVDEILSLMRDAVSDRRGPGRTGVFLSGGSDSSAIVSMLAPAPISTFSFRCRGRSYDESRYARFVADRFGTRHHELDYGPEDLALIEQVAAHMDDPSCDLGIAVASFLLGRAAAREVTTVFSGEGGDELFAGHPVYQADRAAQLIDWIPRRLTTPLRASRYRWRAFRCRGRACRCPLEARRYRVKVGFRNRAAA